MKGYQPIKKLIENIKYLNTPYLMNLYREFNKKYFNNQLNEYPIVVKSLKKVVANVISTGIKNKPETWSIKNIIFSTQLEYNENEIKGIMLHEMIHVKLIEEHRTEFGGQHGLFFMQELRDLQKKVFFKIPITEDITYKSVSKDTMKEKEIIAIILNTMHSVSVFNIRLKNIIINEMKKMPKIWLDKFHPIIIISKNIQLLKYPIQRKISIRNYKNYTIDEKFAKEIIDTGGILYKF